MNKKIVVEKIGVIFAGTWIGNRLGLLFPVVGLLILLMIVDYISGMLASKREVMEYPANEKYGWSSKRSIIGIYKKAGYMITIFVAVCIDYLLHKFAEEIGLQYGPNTIFGLLVSTWFVINEIISILENAGRLGVELPDFLTKLLSELRQEINDSGK